VMSSVLFLRFLMSSLIVDIKELKLLGGFDHPNIVRFVRLPVPSQYPRF